MLLLHHNPELNAERGNRNAELITAIPTGSCFLSSGIKRDRLRALATGVGIAPTLPGLQPGVQTDYTIQGLAGSAGQRDFRARRCHSWFVFAVIFCHRHDEALGRSERDAERATLCAVRFVAAPNEQAASIANGSFHDDSFG